MPTQKKDLQLRLFTAICLPSDAMRALHDIQNEIAKKAPYFLRKIPEENLHITLNFIGAVEAQYLPEMIDKLSHVVVLPFEIVFEKIEFIRRGRRGALIWAKALENDSLRCLKAQIEQAIALTSATVPHDFSPHVTLFRLKSLKKLSLLQALIAKTACPPLTFSGSSFSLMQSITTPSGVHYRELRRFDNL